MKKIRVEHMHIPDVSIPDGERSDTGSRAVLLEIKITMGRKAVKGVVAKVITGDFTLHKNLAGQVADEAVTKFELPELMPYESAVLIGLLTEDDQQSVFSTTHGAREKALIVDMDAYDILHLAAAGVALAIRRGRELDTAEPSGKPVDTDQLLDPIYEEFEVTPKVLEKFESDVRDGIVVLHEEISQSAQSQAAMKPDSDVISSDKVQFSLRDYTVGRDPFAD